jgi:hypothetical protein
VEKPATWSRGPLVGFGSVNAAPRTRRRRGS